MKYIIVTFAMACFLCSCKNDNADKMKMEDEIYRGIEKRLDSFVNESVSTLSINRIKKVAKRIEQIGLSEELVLDTLPDNSRITFKKINGNAEFYLKDEISLKPLYSISTKESLRADFVALELFENIRRRDCEHWRKICNDPDLTSTQAQKFKCKLNIELYCN